MQTMQEHCVTSEHQLVLDWQQNCGREPQLNAIGTVKNATTLGVRGLLTRHAIFNVGPSPPKTYCLDKYNGPRRLPYIRVYSMRIDVGGTISAAASTFHVVLYVKAISQQAIRTIMREQEL
jgi:hypothetical protein